MSANQFPDNFGSFDGELRPRLVGVREACRLLGIQKSRLYELAASGRVVKVRLDGRALVTLESIDRLVEKLVSEVPQR